MNTRVQGSHSGGRWRNNRPGIVRVLETTRDRLAATARLTFQNPTRQALLKVLCTHDTGVPYRMLFDALPVSERHVRELVRDLRDAGIVETPGNPALIQFTTRDVMVAAKEVLAFIASDWVAAVTGDETHPRGEDHSPTGTEPHTDRTGYLQVMSSIIRGYS